METPWECAVKEAENLKVAGIWDWGMEGVMGNSKHGTGVDQDCQMTIFLEGVGCEKTHG